jgi:NAD(P) transhydrogenase subunit alpha
VGGTFVDLALDPVDDEGGYAEPGDLRAQRQAERLAPHVAGADVLITTVSVPGRPAPRLVTAAMAAAMKPGSVVIDLAAEGGSNVEGSRAGEDADLPVPGGTVRVYGMQDAAAGRPVDASRLYARNVANLLLLMVKGGRVVPDLDDEIVAATCLTHDGHLRHAPTAALLGEGSGG